MKKIIYLFIAIIIIKTFKSLYDDYYETGLWINYNYNLIPLKELNAEAYEEFVVSIS